jgi:hypothetical protein
MYKSEFSEVSYLNDLNVAFVKWKKFCRRDDYRNPLLYALEIMRNHKGCHYAADTRDGFENEPDDIQWVSDVFLTQAALTDCKAIFFIIDSDNKLKEELEKHSGHLRKQFGVHYCFGLDEVKGIIESTYKK